MSEHLDRVKGYLLDLWLTIVTENEADELVVVDDEDNGIKQLVIDCEPPIVVLEQLIAEVPAEPGNLLLPILINPHGWHTRSNFNGQFTYP